MEPVQEKVTPNFQCGMKRLLQYLKATLGKGILFRGGNNVMMEACKYAHCAGSLTKKILDAWYCFS